MSSYTGIDKPDIHYFTLDQANPSVNVTCARKCGRYKDIWEVLIHQTGSDDTEKWRIDNRTKSKLRATHPEFEMQVFAAPDDCSGNVSTLNIKLMRSDINSTSRDILVSCGVQHEQNPIVFASMGAVVHLPFDQTTPSAASSTASPNMSSSSMETSTIPSTAQVGELTCG